MDLSLVSQMLRLQTNPLQINKLNEGSIYPKNAMKLHFATPPECSISHILNSIDLSFFLFQKHMLQFIEQQK